MTLTSILVLWAVVIASSYIIVFIVSKENTPEAIAARRKRKAEELQRILNNPEWNTNNWEIHQMRMNKSRKSQFKGTYYYVGPRGGWYYINSNGRKTYC